MWDTANVDVMNSFAVNNKADVSLYHCIKPTKYIIQYIQDLPI